MTSRRVRGGLREFDEKFMFLKFAKIYELNLENSLSILMQKKNNKCSIGLQFILH